MCKTILVVIIYNKTLKESLTLNCLLNEAYANTDLLIINNGPHPLEFDENFIRTLGSFVKSIENKEFIDNRPLSWIYNNLFTEYHDYDRFILFDDDSVLKNNHMEKLNYYYSSDIDLQLPNIFEKTDGKLYYPAVNQTVQKICDGQRIDPQHSVISIGSGLVIYRSLVEKFSEINMELFDSRFALYGVDFSFFNRIELLKKKNINITIQVVGTLNHSLSRVDESYSKWRTTERLYDNVLSIKYYSRSKSSLLIRVFRLSCKQLVNFRFSNLAIIIITFIRGKHPRCSRDD